MATKGSKKATTSKAKKKASKPRASAKAATGKKKPAPKAKPAAKKKAAKSAGSSKKKPTAARATVRKSTGTVPKAKDMKSKPTKAAGKKAAPAKEPAAGAKVTPFRPRAAKKAPAKPAEESPAALRAKKRARQRAMQKFRAILLEKQGSLLQAYHIAKGDSQTTTTDGTEDYIDYAVSSYAREFSLSLSEMERKNLRLVEEALSRLDRKTYGECQQCGNEIPIPRLEVEPWARHCIRCQELEEQGLLEERDSEWDDEEAVSSDAETRLAGEGDEESDEEEREESN